MKRLLAVLALAAFCSGPVLAQTAAPEQRSGQRAKPQPAMKADQYKTEAEARQRCGMDQVVWVNPRSKVYHASDSKDYGKTKRGAYMCKAEAERAKFRAPKARGKAKS